MIALLAAMLLAADPAMAGFYRSQTNEVGAAIELDPDGTFLYGLDYGAVSEGAEGKWVREGDTIYLTATKMQGAWNAPNFARQPLTIKDGDLYLIRYDRNIRFVREGDPAPPPNRNNRLDKKN